MKIASASRHYNYFRDYDPSVGRYVQSDPIGLDGGLNTFAYVGGDPVAGVDPLGLEYGAAYSTELRHMGWRPPPPKECCGKPSYFDCLANCIEKHRFSWNAVTAVNLGNTALNAAFGRTSRGGISKPAHSTSWQHRVGSAASRATGNVRYSHAGRAIGRAFIVPLIAEGFYDLGVELRCAFVCADCDNRDNP